MPARDPLITVTSDDPDLARSTCRAAEQAVSGLASCNIILADPVGIVLVDALAENCVGLFHCESGLIELLSPGSYREARSTRGLYSPLSDDAFFASVIVHEITHAAYEAAHACPIADCPATAEYLAYAMTLRALPDDLRRGLLAHVPANTRVVRDELSAVLALVAPEVFAQKAWLHFSQRPDPCGYAGQIMSGAIVLDRERP